MGANIEKPFSHSELTIFKRASSDGDNIYRFNTTFSKDAVFLYHLLIFSLIFFLDCKLLE